MRNTLVKISALSAFLLPFAGSVNAKAAPNATQLVEKAEFQTRGKTIQAQLNMTVKRGTTRRDLEVKVWGHGNDKAVVKILAPAKDEGVSNLRLKFDLWQYLPNLERTIKTPPSMMLQSWMGSDFTNDDLVKTSSLGRDYTHKLLGEENQAGMKTYKIELLPKKDAAVTWGKIFLWVREKDSVPVRQEFFTEGGELAKIMIGSDLKTFGAHTIPTKLTMKLPRKPENETTIVYKDVKFDEPIADNVFTQEFLKKRVK